MSAARSRMVESLSEIETVARASGYAAQATSVAGVAQRTGATVYYV